MDLIPEDDQSRPDVAAALKELPKEEAAQAEKPQEKAPEKPQEISSLVDLVEADEKRIAKLPPKERQKAFQAAQKRDPKNPMWSMELAREAANRGDHKETISWASQTLELEPKNEEALMLRAWARTARKDYKAALRDLNDLDAETYEQLPALNADLFVCQVSEKDWAAARPLVDLIPEDDQSRPDVVAALKELPKEEAAQAEKPQEKAPEKPQETPDKPEKADEAEPPAPPATEPVPPPPPAPEPVAAPTAEPPVTAPATRPSTWTTDEILFDAAKSRLTNIAKAILDGLVLRLKNNLAATCTISASTDPKEKGGDHAALARARAEAARDYLMKRHSIDGSRIASEVKGDGNSPDATRNRRAIVMVTFR